MPSSSILFSGAVVGSLFTQVALAYTVVQIPSSFMNKNIDPIKYPGAYDKSHLHSFYGSDAIKATTNSSAELQKGCTNADNANDLSSYWVPTLLYTKDSGKTYEPAPLFRFSAYYNLGETEAQVPIPQNLRMVAGNADATTAAEMPADAKISWFCETEKTSKAEDVEDDAKPSDNNSTAAVDKNGFPSKTCSTHLQTLIYFPQCVNNVTLQTAYKSKTYGTENYCPKGMYSMPQLRFSIRYDLRKALPNGWDGEAPLRQACGGNIFCSHADFINGWTKMAAENMLATTKEKQHFSLVTGDRVKTNCTQHDADPKHGTSDYAESLKLMGKRSVEAVGWSSHSRMVKL
ncbi:hypothetical protein MCOR25_001766 [Pyricularia grisea]|uniref:DUF1996 domain-containing protein n=1 Tax=Pyricularia grisea TaxID=148305 RepID=A0A6P8B7B6_PYRGI|nr:hypothetical protein PgNI_05229 [Pyricularia grisea]KAI6380114.1 hypothetical protein MCOR25_001766 [Pyricularia grisea]TLD11226.1 hypothetical protein PgNI_05229 [Pyricularia grisea]